MPERMSDILWDAEHEDEEVETGKARKGYHDWEAGAPHDPNHQAPFEYITNIPHWRRRITASLWHLIALYGCLTFLAVVFIVVFTILTMRLHSAASRVDPGIPISFNASESLVPVVTVYSTVDGSTVTIEELATRTVEERITAPSSTMVVAKQVHITKVVFYTSPPIVMTTWVDARKN